MDRGKAVPPKRSMKGKALPPPGDFIALGKQARSGSDPNLQKLGTTSSEKKLPTAGIKRESSSILSASLAPKKPKLQTQGQTFTPLGRPGETERRASPAPSVNFLFEESAVEVDPVDILEELAAAEDDENDERVEGLICGTVKLLRSSRSKPDQVVFLTLMYLAKAKPAVFNTELVIEAMCSLLKRDLSLNFKAKGNALTSVMACNVLTVAYSEEENWPDEFVKVYIEDALGERVWVDRADCKGFADNIQTAFNTNIPKGSSLMGPEPSKGEQSGPGSPSSWQDDEDSRAGDSESSEKSNSGVTEQQNINVFPRYPYQQDNIESYVLEVIKDQMNRRQTMDATARNLIRLMTTTCGYGEVRLLAAQKLEMWLQNPKLARAAQELLMSVCMNCNQHDQMDLDVIAQIIKIRMKTKPLINHFLNCIRELLNQHPENLKMVLTHTVYNELSTARNPNNMSIIGVIFQTTPEQAAKILAEIFLDLLSNKEDYLRAVRALLREVVRTLRHEINFTAFCLGLMQDRSDKLSDLATDIKERFLVSIADLVTLCILLGITPAIREAAAASTRGERKDLEVLCKYQDMVAMIERDAIWWLHVVVPKFGELKAVEYVHCIHKVLFMESAEHYYNKDNWPPETDRIAMLRLASECPVQEDTLMRILVIGLSRELPLGPNDALEMADQLIKRAASLYTSGRAVLHVERFELVDALFNLCTYRHPDNIVLPKGYKPPTLAISALYWKAWIMLLILTAFNPSTFGFAAWENYPTLKCLMEMVMTNNNRFPPPTTATDENMIEEIRSRERQVAEQEKQEILEFESYLAASTTKVTITEANSHLISQLTTLDPNGIARRPPQQILDQLKALNESLKIGQMLCRSRSPDFLLDIIQRQGTSQSMPWLAELVESSEGSLDVLPVQCLCEFLLHEPQDTVKDTMDDETAKFERHKKRQKMHKQEQLLTRLQNLVHSTEADSRTTYEVLDYFLKRLSSHQIASRAQATKGLCMVLSKSQVKVSDDKMDVDQGEVEEDGPYTWLLKDLPSLPMFSQVKIQTCTALRRACQIETDPAHVSAYIIFLSQYAMDQNLHELDDLALDIAQLIVERTTVINCILPQEGSTSKSARTNQTMEALISLFISYLRKGREPNKEIYPWFNTQDQIILQWQCGESATMHILVVHAMIILLTYGSPEDFSKNYQELLDTWFLESGSPPSAYLQDTSEEALLLPDWLKLRMIRSRVQILVDAALEDLEPAQLLLFVQSFGIPVPSMSKLLQCLDNSVTLDPTALKEAVVDKAYMAQLIEVQHRRGAQGGNKFYQLLSDSPSSQDITVEEDRTDVREDTMWRSEGVKDTVSQQLSHSEIMDILFKIFDTRGQKASEVEIQFQQLLQKTVKDQMTALHITQALQKMITNPGTTQFCQSIAQSARACSLYKILVSEHSAIGETLLHHMRTLSQSLATQKSPLAAIVQQYLKSHGNLEQQKMDKSLVFFNTSDKEFLEELKSMDQDLEARLECLVGEKMISMSARCLDTRPNVACSVLLESQDHPESNMLLSTAILFIDWLALLDPEVIRSAPDLQQKLIFAKKRVPSAELSEHHSNYKPYLLALLTHQSSWATLHRCIDCLLRRTDGFSNYDPSSVLDFLWACIHIPKIWQGRERKVQKNQTKDDVLALTDEQLVSLIQFIVEEASNINSKTVDGNRKESLSPHGTPVTVNNRMELLTCCLCDKKEKVKIVINHIHDVLKNKRSEQGLYQVLLMELYLRHPYLLPWVSSLKYLMTDGQMHTSISLMDTVSHRLLVSIGNPGRGKKADTKMSDANLACRKLASEHPILILRQLPVIAAFLKGKSQFSFAEMRHRNYLMTFTHVLGLLELLEPQIFQQDNQALEDVLDAFFSLMQVHGLEQKQLAPLIMKFVIFLHKFGSYEPQRGAAFLQKHVDLLGAISSQYPDFSILKSLLAGLTLRRQNQEGATPTVSGDSNPILPATRPTSPWTVNQLMPFIQRIRKESSPEDVLGVLQDLDETSKRKIDILDHFVVDLKRLMLSSNDQCRNTAHALVMRFIKQNPKQGVGFVSTFLQCLDSKIPDIINSALRNLPEFTVLCQEKAGVILQKAFTVGINSSIETSTYISETLQLLNLDTS
ncbi:hypothetical protein CHS0354_035142 [Potamilus streckersoni]|uniref:Integrator complex subunit 1 n=1 Tax=Potamilus streckersoni TaxID=2493646 RepID=A0AAE0WAH9_9BIVA|nr:hypothetical protein CHS0354_035142 [Potamilus streckersoni]